MSAEEQIQEDEQTPEDIQAQLLNQFPNMKPIGMSPLMFTLNGCGLSVVFSYDHQQGTYVKLYCLTFIFIPLFCFASYRVADDEDSGMLSRSWYFLGKEKVPIMIKFLNAGIIFCLLWFFMGIAFVGFKNGDWNVKRKDFSRAAERLEKKEYLAAVNIYHKYLNGSHKDDATEKLREIYSTHVTVENAESYDLLKLANRSPLLKKILPDLYPTCKKLLNDCLSSNPKNGLNIYKLCYQLKPTDKDLPALKNKLTKAWYDKDPKNMDACIAYAGLLEKQQKYKKCVAILLPHKKALKNTDGTRVLGLALISLNRKQEAHDILKPYVFGRMKNYSKKEKEYGDYYSKLADKYWNNLTKKQQPRSVYNQMVKETDDNLRQQIWLKYFQGVQKSDPGLSRLTQEIIDLENTIPVGFELGILQIDLAHAQENKAKEKKGLQEAEKTLLMVSGASKGNSQYKLYLGKVYFWLGKYKAGEKLFAELLKKTNRHFMVLTELATIYRRLGEIGKAKKMIHEAYNKASKKDEKQYAARISAVIASDLDEMIKWTKRTDLTSDYNKASLFNLQGQKSLVDNKEKAALTFFTKAIDTYNKLPESSTTLNNSALSYRNRFNLTNDMADFQKMVQMLIKAYKLSPRNSIQISNTQDALISSAVIDYLSSKIDLKATKADYSTETLSHFYSNEKEYQSVHKHILNHDMYKEAVDLMYKSLLIAPKRKATYTALVDHAEITRDIKIYKKIYDRIKPVKFDRSEQEKALAEFYSGKKFPEYLKTIKETIKDNQKRLIKVDKKDKLSMAYLLSQYVTNCMTRAVYKDFPDAKELKPYAEKAYKLAPSSATFRNLLRVNVYQLSQLMAAKESSFNKSYKRLRSAMNDLPILLYYMNKYESFRKKVLKEELFKTIISMHRERVKNFPTAMIADDWVLANTYDTKLAAKIKTFIKTDEIELIDRKIQLRLESHTASSQMTEYFYQRMNGNANAKKVLSNAKKKGLPMP